MPDHIDKLRRGQRKRADSALAPASAPVPAEGPTTAAKPERPPLGRFPAGTRFGWLDWNGIAWDAALDVAVPAPVHFVQLKQSHQSVHQLLRLLWRQWCEYVKEHPECV